MWWCKENSSPGEFQIASDAYSSLEISEPEEQPEGISDSDLAELFASNMFVDPTHPAKEVQPAVAKKDAVAWLGLN